jgi:hypothetical protein
MSPAQLPNIARSLGAAALAVVLGSIVEAQSPSVVVKGP